MNQSKTAYVNDMQMHYLLGGEGDTLLCLHGFMGSSADWSHVFNLAPQNYSLLMPDLRGHGRSDNPTGEFTFRQCAADVIALLDLLNIEKASTIGLSGGAQVLLYLATKTDPIDKLVLVSTAPYFPQQARQLMRSHRFESASPEELEQMRSRHAFGDAQIKRLYAIGHSFKDSYEDVNFTPAYLTNIKAETLIVHGDKDPLYPVVMAVDLFNAIPKANLWVVPDGGHLPIFGKNVDNFRTTVINFLEG